MATKAVPTQHLFMTAIEHHKRGAEMMDSGKGGPAKELSKAIELYQLCLNVEVDHPDVLFMLAAAHIQCESTGVAVALLEKVLALEPEYLEALLDLGTAHMREFRRDKAIEIFRRGAAIIEQAKRREKDVKLRSSETADSLLSQFYTNIGAAHVNEGKAAEGIPYLRRALKLFPDNTHAHWNLALLLLEEKRWEEGFREYEWGYPNNNRYMRTYGPLEPLPTWDGSGNQRIIVFGEQGQGDEILFAGFVNEVIRRSKSVVIDCNPALVHVFRESFPDACAVYPTRKIKDPEWSKHHEVDAKISMASLGNVIPFSSFDRAYIRYDPTRSEEYRRRLLSIYGGTGPVIGIAWYGGYKKTRTDQRMIPLAHWEPVFDALPDDAIIVSLQYNENAPNEVTEYMYQGGRHIVHLASINAEVDYAPKLDLAAACDLAICVNMTMVHAMGAADLECWTLTPYAHAWRYGQHGDERMPWYDSVRQFHQGADRDWGPVMEAVAQELKRRW